MKNLKDIERDIFEVNARITHINEDFERLKQEPEFKDGQWVIALIRDAEYLIRYKDDNGHISSTFFIVLGQNNYSIGGWFDKIERPATPQEIESHLRKICDEKYIGKKVKGLYDYIGNITEFSKYLPDSDELVYNSGTYTSLTIYKQGKWAEVIPDKKKLPCTKDEAIKLIQDYTAYYRKDSGCNVFDFVNSYTD